MFTEQNDPPIPATVIEGLARVRETGATNMMDRLSVLVLLSRMHLHEAYTWVASNKHRYVQALQVMGEREASRGVRE